ncbi:sulfate permease, SulP family [Terribacillus saccharophilus]|uniref:Sulfate permease, SulP family n=1 Tax=Terribacillus saccharophilus TaxID=361277 RepID=A0AAX2EGF0_9BACI|nr:sulfate permease, SulP family [Terribacillus saccharophilus]
MKRLGRYSGYNLRTLRRDIIAGIIVGIVAIPLGMSFAIASGVNPEYGLYTVIIGGLLISLLGGSRFQIGGPTGAFVPILLGVVIQFGYQDLLLAGIMAGILLIIFGLLKLGSLIKFIPRPVVVGFTAGIAVIIFTGQIGNFTGIQAEQEEGFLQKMQALLAAVDTISMYSLIIAGVSLAAILLTPKILPKVPGALAGLILSTVVAVLFFQGQVATIGSVYGDIPSQLPQLQLPVFTLDKIIYLLPSAVAIALLGGVESLLSATVADNMAKTKHHSNRELIGQGVANIAVPLFGGIPATGAIARTATNIRSNAFSPVSGVVHCVFVLIILLLFAPYASAIPLASMAPILMVVAWNMSERKEVAHIIRMRTFDSFILIVTFALTVLADLTVGVGCGLLLAFVVFVKRMSTVLFVKDEQIHVKETDGVRMWQFEGPLFFGSTDILEEVVEKTINEEPDSLILDLQKVSYMDTSAEAALHKLVDHYEADDKQLLFLGVHGQPERLLHKTGLLAKVGEEYTVNKREEAVRICTS